MGWGISLENLERFFDPAFTTQGGGVGTGLGLSTGYNIVQRLKGWIYVESVVGRGLRLGWSGCEKGEGLEKSIWKVKERKYVGTQSVGGMVWASGGFFLSDLYAKPQLEFWGREPG